jgi:hypothetical protein
MRRSNGLETKKAGYDKEGRQKRHGPAFGRQGHVLQVIEFGTT